MTCCKILVYILLGGFSFSSFAHFDSHFSAEHFSWKISPVARPLGAYLARTNTQSIPMDGAEVGWITPGLASKILGHPVTEKDQFLELQKHEQLLNIYYGALAIITANPYSKAYELNVTVQNELLEQEINYSKGLKCVYGTSELAKKERPSIFKALARPQIYVASSSEPQLKTYADAYRNQSCGQYMKGFINKGGPHLICEGSISCEDKKEAKMCFCDALEPTQTLNAKTEDENNAGIGYCPSADECLKQCTSHKSHFGNSILEDSRPGSQNDKNFEKFADASFKALAPPLKLGAATWNVCVYNNLSDGAHDHVTTLPCVTEGPHCLSPNACEGQACVQVYPAHFKTGSYK